MINPKMVQSGAKWRNKTVYCHLCGKMTKRPRKIVSKDEWLCPTCYGEKFSLKDYLTFCDKVVELDFADLDKAGLI